MPVSDPIFSYAGTNLFGLSDVGDKAHPTFVDIDGDLDLDAFVGNSIGNTVFFKNTGTTTKPVFSAAVSNPFGLGAVSYKASPSFADIDGDGDLDAFIGTDGNTKFFRNTGTANIPIFATPVTNYFGSNIGGDPTFVDIDGDGDLDVFTGNRYENGVVFLENIGTVNNPIFKAAITNPFGLNSWFTYKASSTFVDIDGDGDLDAFVSSEPYTFYSPTTLFFRNVGTVSAPVFYEDRQDSFGLGGYKTNTIVADIDGDNDLDIFSGNGSGDIEFFQNSGRGNSSNFDNWDSTVLSISRYGDPTFVDIDGDGDLDAFVGRHGNYYYETGGEIKFYKNIGTPNVPNFATAIANPFGLRDVGSFSSPAFADIDNDNDLDAFIGNESGDLIFFKNTGTRENPFFATPTVNPFGLSDVGNNAAPTFIDIDNDEDLDAFVGNYEFVTGTGYVGNTLFFRNIGTINYPVFDIPQTNPFGLPAIGYSFINESLNFIDADKDGDWDIFKDASFFKNTGTINNPTFTFQGYDPFGMPDTDYYSWIDIHTFADIDGDGDFDAFLTTHSWDDGSSYVGGHFVINNTAPNISNLTLPENYTRNTPLNLKDIVISDADSASVTATLTLSNAAAGKLSTATSGAVTSSYNAVSGEWKASGAIANVNALLAGVVFTPAANFSGAFSINASVSDDAAPALRGSKDFTAMLVSTPGNTVLTGTSSSNNTITYASATAAVTVSLNITTQQNTLGAGLDTITAVENLIGSAFADNLTGNSTYNILDGRAGNDILRGWSGADTMIGGPGNDTMYVENPRDAVIEKPNEGSDTVSSSITFTLPINVEKLILTGATAINGTGNELANVITGNGAANQLNGQAGNDTLDGGAGNDTLTGWSGADTMKGGLGNDLYYVENAGDVVTEILSQGIDTVSSRLTYTLPANVENLTLTATDVINGTGNELANVITGSSAANQLNGGAGNDTLDGGLGANRLTGGTGNDVFKFTSMGPVDVIVDYNVANDTIQLENSVFSALTAVGALPASQFRIGAQALDANDHILYNKATGALIYDANGNAAGGAAQIATIGSGLALTSADIVVI